MSRTVRLMSAVLSAVITLGLYAAAPVSAATESEINMNTKASAVESGDSEAINNAELLQFADENAFKAGNTADDKEEAVGAVRKNLWNCTVSYTGTYVYTGSEIVPSMIRVSHKGIELVEGKDYTLSFSNNINVGIARMTITGIGSYTGTAEREYSIAPRNVSSLSVTLKNSTFVYDGRPHNAGVTVKYGKIELKEGVNYTLVYSDNVKIGNATVTVIGTGNFTGQVSKTYVIGRLKVFSNCSVTLGTSSYTYSGTEKRPAVTVKDGTKLLTSGVDYTVTYSNNVNAGTASVFVKGKGIYSGTVSKSFSISPKQLYYAAANLMNTKVEYDGENIPEVVVKDGTSVLEKDKDYIVSYSNNTKAGSVAYAIITPKGNYSGRIVKVYEVVKKPIEKCTFDFSTKTAQIGELSNIKPVIKNGSLLLKEGTDYRLSYSSDNAAGTGCINVQGIGNYSSSYKTEIKIENTKIENPTLDIRNATVSMSGASACLYNDGVIRSLIIVKYDKETLCYNNDYTLSFKTSSDKVIVTVQGKNKYSGTKTFSYEKSLDSSNIGDRFVWGRDNWSFDNSSQCFNTNQVKSDIKESLISEFKMNKNDEAAVNNALSVNGDFRGSCYGMTVSSILSNLGYLDCTPYKLEKNRGGIDICNFVQSMYTGTRFSELTRKSALSGYDLKTVENKPYTQKEYIDTLESALKNNDTVVSLIYRIEYEDGDDSVTHCVVAYGVEDCDYKYDFKNGSQKSYNKRIVVYDPNFGSSNTISDAACIYYNQNDGSWICPVWINATFKKHPVSCYWNSEMGKSLSKGSISSIIKYNSISCTEDLMSGRIYDYAASDLSGASVGSDENAKTTSQIMWAQKPEEEPDFGLIKMGDVDFNGSITIEDATMIQNYLCEMTALSPEQLQAADLDGDGDVTVTDVATIQFYLAELITTLV